MNETVFIKKIKHQNFTTVDNGFVKNEKLSWKAKGILLYLVSLPEDWILNQNELKNHSSDGLASLRAGLEELKDNGYLNVTHLKDDKGKFSGTKYEIDELGLLVSPKCDFPKTDNPNSENPKTENRNLQNTNNIQNTNKLNTNIPSTDSSIGSDFPSEESILNIPSSALAEEEAPKKKVTRKGSYSKSDYDECFAIITENIKKIKEQGKEVSEATYPYNVLRGMLKTKFNTYGVEETKAGLKNSINNTWLVNEMHYKFNVLFSDKMFPNFIANETSTGSTPKYSSNKPISKVVDYSDQNWKEEF